MRYYRTITNVLAMINSDMKIQTPDLVAAVASEAAVEVSAASRTFSVHSSVEAVGTGGSRGNLLFPVRAVRKEPNRTAAVLRRDIGACCFGSHRLRCGGVSFPAAAVKRCGAAVRIFVSMYCCSKLLDIPAANE